MNKIRKTRKEYQSWGKGYYHLSTDGWKDGKLFYTDGQYAHGMTLMGLLSLRFALTIYDFTLMDNHVHLLLSGTGAASVCAFDYLKHKISARLVKDGFPPLPQDYFFKLTPVKDEEQMRVNYLYIDRNILERGVCLPGGYPWGAAYLHHAPLSAQLQGIPAGRLHKRELMSLTDSHAQVPPSWEFHPELGLLPGSWINRVLFLKLFPSPKDYQTRLTKDYEAFVRLGRQLDEKVVLTANEIKEIARTVAREMFGGKRISDLSNGEKAKMCLHLQEKYCLDQEQIALVLSMPQYLVKQLLGSKDYGTKNG